MTLTNHKFQHLDKLLLNIYKCKEENKENKITLLPPLRGVLLLAKVEQQRPLSSASASQRRRRTRPCPWWGRCRRWWRLGGLRSRGWPGLRSRGCQGQERSRPGEFFHIFLNSLIPRLFAPVSFYPQVGLCEAGLHVPPWKSLPVPGWGGCAESSAVCSAEPHRLRDTWLAIVKWDPYWLSSPPVCVSYPILMVWSLK